MFDRGISTSSLKIYVKGKACKKDIAAGINFLNAISEVSMIDLRADYEACEDNDWLDLINTYWNIHNTCDGEIRTNALRDLQGEIHLRISKLPPSEDEVLAHNPTMDDG